MSNANPVGIDVATKLAQIREHRRLHPRLRIEWDGEEWGWHCESCQSEGEGYPDDGCCPMCWLDRVEVVNDPDESCDDGDGGYDHRGVRCWLPAEGGAS